MWVTGKVSAALLNISKSENETEKTRKDRKASFVSSLFPPSLLHPSFSLSHRLVLHFSPSSRTLLVEMYPIPHAACCKTNSLILGDPGRRAAVGTAAAAAPKSYKCGKKPHTQHSARNFNQFKETRFFSTHLFSLPGTLHRLDLLRALEGNNLLDSEQ